MRRVTEKPKGFTYLSPKAFNLVMRREALDISSTIRASGGPRNKWEKALYDLAEITGVSDVEINAAASSKRPVLKGLEDKLPIDDF